VLKKISEFIPSKYKKRNCAAVIVAAGKGQRMNSDTNKQFIEIYDKPILAYTLEAFENCKDIAEIVVVAREEEIFVVADLIREYGISKASKVVAGGKTRQESVICGLNEVKKRHSLVAIHDGARPFILPQIISEAISEATLYGACAVGVRMVDTVKRCNEDQFIESTVNRENLWLVQTPQVFDTAVLMSAHQSAIKLGIAVTDDCMAVERMGIQVKMLEGCYDNIKITTSSDLSLGEKILEKRGC
jgi:2-C-methyl-D-erythritol 4-phosphate cytidylyltransferase